MAWCASKRGDAAVGHGSALGIRGRKIGWAAAFCAPRCQRIGLRWLHPRSAGSTAPDGDGMPNRADRSTRLVLPCARFLGAASR